MRFTYTEQEYLAAAELHARWSKKKQMLVVGGVIVILCLALGLYGTQHSYLSGALVLGLIGGFVGGCLMRFGVYRWRTRRTFAQHKSIRREFQMTWNEQGIILQTGADHSSFPWSEFLKWKESDDLFLLYGTDIMFNMVPKRVFASSESLAEFESYLHKIRRA